ncbi:MAG: methyltransferase domain-containing protein [archaeon]|nr:methyltransferase domain-containing protein [archaeon]
METSPDIPLPTLQDDAPSTEEKVIDNDANFISTITGSSSSSSNSLPSGEDAKLGKWTIENLPFKWVKGDLEKALRAAGLGFLRVTKVFKQTFGKVQWESQEQLDRAVASLGEAPLAGSGERKQRLRLHVSQAGKLKTQRKREREETFSKFVRNLRQRQGTEGAEREELQWMDPLDEQQKKVVASLMPLSGLTYEEQLAFKSAELRAHLENAVRVLFKATSYSRLPWVVAIPRKQPVCEFLGVVPCETAREHYRSKTEFLVGYDAEGKPAVGFPIIDMISGSTVTAEPTCVRITSRQALAAAASFQRFLLTKTDAPPYRQGPASGLWRLLAVRSSSRTGEFMVVVMGAEDLYEPAEAQRQKRLLAAHFQAEFPSSELVSCLWLNFSTDGKQPDPSTPYEVLFGAAHYTERLFDLKFQVSPAAFFQNNVEMAETLFTAAREWVSASSAATLLDVCCGTGVIGISMAASVRRVLGVDMCESAVADANANAALNGLSNCLFVPGKAEDVLPRLIQEQEAGEELCAVVDPARPGLHISVIHTLRKCEKIRRLVYVSCNPGAFVNDLAHLCRASSKTMPGTPFRPVKAQGFDMFPQTEHVELLVLFER